MKSRTGSPEPKDGDADDVRPPYRHAPFVMDKELLSPVFDDYKQPDGDAAFQKSLLGCLTAFCSLETMTDKNNLFDCNVCTKRGDGLQEAEKRLMLASLPPLLTLQLKRFVHLPNSHRLRKINDMITFPESFKISEGDIFVPSAAYQDREEGGEFAGETNREAEYVLYGLTVHTGTMTGGHYIAYVKSEGKTWYGLSDSRVWKCDLKEVLTQEAYILFYARSDYLKTASE